MRAFVFYNVINALLYEFYELQNAILTTPYTLYYEKKLR